MARKSNTHQCSFCGKNQEKVRRLIAGPGGVYICDECIELCNEILREEQAPPHGPSNRRLSGLWQRMIPGRRHHSSATGTTGWRRSTIVMP